MMVDGKNQVLFRSVIVLVVGVLSACAFSPPLPAFEPVVDPERKHLGVTVVSPGVQDWLMLQEFLPYGWRVTFKHGEGTISTKIAQVFVARIDPTTVKKLEREGELRKLVDYEIEQGLARSSARFEKKKFEIKPQPVHGVDGYYVRLDWEERDNLHFPGRILTMKNVSYRFQNPKDPNLLILVWVSTREPIEHQTYSVESLAETFLQSMQFSCCFTEPLQFQIVKDRP